MLCSTCSLCHVVLSPGIKVDSGEIEDVVGGYTILSEPWGKGVGKHSRHSIID